MNHEDDPQGLYLGKWVEKKTFRAFVYNENGQKLCKSWDEYEKAIESGEWVSEKKSVGKREEIVIAKDDLKEPINIRSAKGRKPKHANTNG